MASVPVLGLLGAAAPAHADDDAVVRYVGAGALCVDDIARFLPAASAERLLTDERVKGEITVDETGRVVGAEFITAGGHVSLNESELYLSTPELERAFTLADVELEVTDAAVSLFVDFSRGESSGLVRFTLDARPYTDEDLEGATELGSGPDIAVSRIGLNSSGSGDDFDYYGEASGIRAFSMASTSCNVGDAEAEWISGGAGNHPVIGQNMFRLLNGRFEQLGQSWLKHSFCALSEPTCGSCQSTNCNTLGIGCADTYWAGLNDGASGGPKYQIDPQGFGSGGTHVHPYDAPSGPSAIRGRLQIHSADITAGGQNFAEIQYITHDELGVNRYNNASWREVNLNLTSITGMGGGQGSVQFEEPAIMAWAANDTGVTIVEVTLSDRGRFNVGYKVSDNGDGTWHYEYAVHNMNSNRSCGSFSIPVPAGVTITNVGFHDVDYHSGEPYDGTDWPHVIEDGAITWATTPYDQNVNANAIRWGTLYNFRFDADAPPVDVDVALGLFTPGTPDATTFTGAGPEGSETCLGDTDANGIVDFSDLLQTLSTWGPCPGCVADFDGNTIVDFNDLLIVLSSWGPC